MFIFISESNKKKLEHVYFVKMFKIHTVRIDMKKITLNISFVDNKRCVELLIKKGANIDCQNVYGDTALHLAAREGQQIFLIEILRLFLLITNFDKYSNQFPIY